MLGDPNESENIFHNTMYQGEILTAAKRNVKTNSSKFTKVYTSEENLDVIESAHD